MRPKRVDACAVRKIDVMDRAHQRGAVRQPRSMPSEPMAKQSKDGRLVEGCEALDPIAIVTRNQRRVIGKPTGTIPIGPSTAIIERLRKIPMIEAQPGLDFGPQQRINKPIVEGEPGLVNGSAAGGE